MDGPRYDLIQQNNDAARVRHFEALAARQQQLNADLLGDNERLRAAVEMAIRSHENLIDLKLIPVSFYSECRRIVEQLRTTLSK